MGVLLLALALLAGVTVPALLARPWGAAAARAPLPEPPAVGSCLSVPSDPAAAGPAVDPATADGGVVDCAGPHRAEVVAAWRADDPIVERLSRFSRYLDRPSDGPDRAMGGVTEHLVTACWRAAQEYITPPGDATPWLPVPPRVVPALLRAPDDGSPPRWRWLSCVVVAADDASWAGPLRWRSTSPVPRPPSLGANCRPDGSAALSRCDLPHRTEVLGWPDRSWVGSADDRAAACVQLAATMTGRADPTFGGRVRVDVVTRQPVPYQGALPLCVAGLVGDGALVGSLIGLGDRELPLR